MSATEHRLTETAMRLFAERGSAGLTISEVATAAGIARGTLYRNVDSIEQLFAKVVESAGVRLHSRIAAALDRSSATDPAARLATAVRLLARLAHEDPAMGRFLVRFGLTDESLRAILTGPPMEDVAAGIAAGRYQLAESMKLTVASFLTGVGISTMWMVLEGHLGWREAGSRAAELLLRALGIPAEEAERLTAVALPPLASD